MDDHPNRIRGDFNQRINQVRQETEHLMQQAREIHGLLGQIREPSGRPAQAGPAGEGPFSPAGEGLYRPEGMPYILEALNRSVGELEAWSQKIFGREEDFKQALLGLEIRAEEMTGLTASLGETLAMKAASLPRLAVLARELATGRHFLKRDQEELAGAVSEAIGLLEQKEQGRRQLLDLARMTLVQGEKKRDHLQELLTNQKTLAEHLETCGKWLERSFEVYEAGPPGFNISPGALRDRSREAQDLVDGLRRFHQGLQPLEKIDVDSLIRVLTERIKAPTPGAEEKPDPGGAPPHVPGGGPETAPLPPDLERLLDTVNSLNEQMNLLSLNAFISSVQGGKKPEELAEVFGDIRVISDRLKTEVLQYQGKIARSTSWATETAPEQTDPPSGRPDPEGGGEGIFRELEALRPVFLQAGKVVQELEALADRLLEHLRWFSGQFQELALLVREETRFGGQILEGLLPLKNALGQLKNLQADQDFQVREINRSIQKTLVQAAPVRKWFADPGAGTGAPLNRVEAVREIVRSLAGELFKQGQDEERLQQELDRLRSLPEAVEQFLGGQTLKQLEFQEAVEKVRGDYQKMNRDLDVQQTTLNTVISQIRRLYENLEPLVRDSREQSAMNRTLLEAFTEIRGRIQEKVTG